MNTWGYLIYLFSDYRRNFPLARWIPEDLPRSVEFWWRPLIGYHYSYKNQHPDRNERAHLSRIEGGGSSSFPSLFFRKPNGISARSSLSKEVPRCCRWHVWREEIVVIIGQMVNSFDSPVLHRPPLLFDVYQRCSSPLPEMFKVCSRSISLRNRSVSTRKIVVSVYLAEGVYDLDRGNKSFSSNDSIWNSTNMKNKNWSVPGGGCAFCFPPSS